jgi:peptidoglycan/xylan/chitin deacetylase (PgdA/CDA1 family)
MRRKPRTPFFRRVHTARTISDQCAAEREDMERGLRVLECFGVKPLGYRSPSTDFSTSTLSLIEEYGFLYDSSVMADDFRTWTS